MSGMVMWSYFQGCMNGISTTLIQNVNLFGKVYFPRLTVPFALVLSNFGQFLLNLVVFLGFYFFYLFFSESFIRPNFFIFLLPLLVLQCAIVGLGVGLWLSALTVKYRDLRFALPFLSQLWLFATPIVYPASSVVQAKWRLLLAMNPMSGIVELNRYAFLGTGTTDGSFICVSMGSGILLLVTGLFLFNKIQRTFVDTI
jgi:lipopolysaccharide transport system permease protein